MSPSIRLPNHVRLANLASLVLPSPLPLPLLPKPSPSKPLCHQYPRCPLFSPITSSSRRQPRLQRHMATATIAPKFPDGSDEAALAAALEPLLQRWTLSASGEGIERTFKFKTFAKTWDFMTAVSLQCKLRNHHPEWSNVYNTTFIRWTTHNPRGLSEKDLSLADLCDALAKDFGEIAAEPAAEDESASGALRTMTDSTALGAGDCCTPAGRKRATGS